MITAFRQQPHHKKFVIVAALLAWASAGFFLIQRSLATEPTVVVTITPETQTTLPGSTANYQVKVQALAGYDGNEVSLKTDSCPAGFTCLVNGQSSLTISSLDVPWNGTLAVAAPATATAGDYSIALRASNGGSDSVDSVTLTVQDFSICCSDVNRIVPVASGDAVTFSFEVSGKGGFTGDVRFTVEGVPAGASVAWDGGSDTVTVPANGGAVTKSFTVQTSPYNDENGTGTPARDYTLTIKGQQVGGSLAHEIQKSFQITDFRIFIATPSQQVEQGERSSSFALQADGFNGFAVNGFGGTVTLSVEWQGATPSGVQYYWNGASSPAQTFDVTPGDLATLTLAMEVPASTPTGDYRFRLRGRYASGLNHLSDLPEALLTVVPAGSGTQQDVTLNVVKDLSRVNYPGASMSNEFVNCATAANGFTGDVTFSVEWAGSAPANTNAHWEGTCSDDHTLICDDPDGRFSSGCGTCSGRDQPTITFRSGEVVLTKGFYFTIGSDAVPGVYPFDVKATFATGTATFRTDLVIAARPPADFNLVPSYPYPAVEPGGSVDYTVTLQSVNDFNDTVTLSANTGDSKITASFNPQAPVVNGSVQSVMTIAAQDSLACGSKSMTVTGTAEGGLTHQITVPLTICSADFSITSVSPNPLTMDPNQTKSYTVTINRTGGFTSDVKINWTATPSP